MQKNLKSLLSEIQALESQVASELRHARAQFDQGQTDKKVSFSPEIHRVHRQLRKSLAKYIFGSNVLFLLSAPVIYSLIVPAIILDLFCGLYQAICFPIYKIPKVMRSEYIRADRHKLAYLNEVEKLNCSFCTYFNGVLAYAREISSRTEQYWCPIRHAFAVKGTHRRYKNFFEYGDASVYHARLQELRNELRTLGPEKSR